MKLPISFAFALLLIACRVSAQTEFESHKVSSQTPRLGFIGGATFSNLKSKIGRISASADTKTGYTFGIIVNIPFGKNFILQPGINWTQKGTVNKESIGNSIYKTTLTNNYVEIPVNLFYHHAGFFLGTGPSLSYAMDGTVKHDLEGETSKERVDFGNKDDNDMRPLDFGVNILAGYQLPRGLLFSVNFTQGVTNLLPGDTGDAKVKSYYFGIKLGYLIKEKK